MLRFIGRRLLVLVPILIGVSVLSFLLLYLIPGDVVDILMGQESGDPQRLAELRSLFGLDQPMALRYVSWLGAVLHGDLGRSFVTRRPVTTEILTALPVTLQLALTSLAVALLIGIPLGVYAAMRRGTVTSAGLGVFVLLALSIPNFWLGILLILAASLYLHWFPPQGLVLLWHQPVAALQQLLFPSVALGLALSAMVMRMTRTCVLDVLAQDYVRTARAKGLRESTVIVHHALRNALLPVVTILGLAVPGLIGGSVIFETIFSIPGMGQLFYNGVMARDYPLVMGILVIGAGLTLVGNLLADLGYALADPRIRHGQT